MWRWNILGNKKNSEKSTWHEQQVVPADCFGSLGHFIFMENKYSSDIMIVEHRVDINAHFKSFPVWIDHNFSLTFDLKQKDFIVYTSMLLFLSLQKIGDSKFITICKSLLLYFFQISPWCYFTEIWFKALFLNLQCNKKK